jgi:hemerythrin
LTLLALLIEAIHCRSNEHEDIITDVEQKTKHTQTEVEDAVMRLEALLHTWIAVLDVNMEEILFDILRSAENGRVGVNEAAYQNVENDTYLKHVDGPNRKVLVETGSLTIEL